MEEILVTTHLIKEFDLGLNGNLYGGRMLDWLDESGALFVHELYNEYFVTYKIGEIVFHKPVKKGTIIKFFVKNVETRKSSVSFEITVKNGNDIEVLTAFMVFVCIDQATGEKKEINGNK
jgi:acyl-CoA hydrolase